MFRNSSSKPLLAIAICLTALSFAHGQGDFEPSGKQNAEPIEPLPTLFGDDAADPIATSFVENDAPVTQSSFYQDLYAAPTGEYLDPAGNFNAGIPQQDIVYSQEVQSLAATQPRARNWRERMRNHFHDASINAVTSGFTASFFGGPGLFPSSFDRSGRTGGGEGFLGSVIGFSVGKRISSRWRSELEFSWRKREWDEPLPPTPTPFTRNFLFDPSFELNTFAGMFNTYYDFDRGPGKIVTPYIGGGLGAAHEEVSIGGGFFTEDNTSFAFQGMAGLSFRMSRQNEFYLETRSFSVVYDRNQSRTSHDLIFGLRRTF